GLSARRSTADSEKITVPATNVDNRQFARVSINTPFELFRARPATRYYRIFWLSGQAASPSALATVAPKSAGDIETWMPAAFRAATLLSAVPSPPEIIAPAWPTRLPGGAVWPAMKPTTGFFTLDLTNAAAFS